MQGTSDSLNRGHLQRVNVVGTSGTGKSTFARQLAQSLNHPYIEMDALFWEPNWTQPSDEAFFARLSAALSQSTWILDGNYDRTIGIKWANVTTVIWVDYSFRRTLYQALNRAIVRSIHQKELWPGTGNKESFLKTFFSKESIILWTLKTYSRNRQRYEQRFNSEEFSHIRFVRLSSPSEAQKFLKSISAIDEEQ